MPVTFVFSSGAASETVGDEASLSVPLISNDWNRELGFCCAVTIGVEVEG